MSAQFVAASMMIPLFESKPSISTRSWFRVCSRSSCPPPSPAPRCLPTASISSMKMMQGEFCLACSKVTHAAGADADKRSTKSEPEMEKRAPLPLRRQRAPGESYLSLEAPPGARQPGIRAPSFWNFWET